MKSIVKAVAFVVMLSGGAVGHAQFVTSPITMGLGSGNTFTLACPSCVTLTGSQALTNKTFDSSNTLTSVALAGTITGTYTMGGTPTLASPAISGTTSGTYTLGGTPTINSPILSGTATGTYTLGGTPTLTAPVINGATSSGSTSIDLSANSGAFKTPTGVNTIGGIAIFNSSLRVPRSTAADVNITASGSTMLIAFTSISAARLVQISCNSTGAAANPIMIVVKDESGSASGTNTITITPTTGLIDGAASKVCVNTAFGSCHFYGQGSNCFTW